MSQAVAHGNLTTDSSSSFDGSPGRTDASISDATATDDSIISECSGENEVIDLTYPYIATETKDWFGNPISIVQPRLEGLVTNDSGDNAFLLAMSRYVLTGLSKEMEILLAEVMTYSIGLKRGQFERFVQKQKDVASAMMENAPWAKSHRACVDNFATIYVVENDPMNPYLGELEYNFLIAILNAPRKHYIWEEATGQILRLYYRLNKPPLVHEVLEILAACLKTAEQDQKKLLSLQDESSWQHSRLEEWLPHTICRIFGQEIEDGGRYCNHILREIDGDILKIVRFLIDMQHMHLEKDDIPKMLKYVRPFSHLIPSLSLQQEDIESEIEYLRKKVENMAIKIESPEP